MHKEYTLADIKELDQDLAQMIVDEAVHLGYRESEL